MRLCYDRQQFRFPIQHGFDFLGIILVKVINLIHTAFFMIYDCFSMLPVNAKSGKSSPTSAPQVVWLPLRNTIVTMFFDPLR